MPLAAYAASNRPVQASVTLGNSGRPINIDFKGCFGANFRTGTVWDEMKLLRNEVPDFWSAILQQAGGLQQ